MDAYFKLKFIEEMVAWGLFFGSILFSIILAIINSRR